MFNMNFSEAFNLIVKKTIDDSTGNTIKQVFIGFVESVNSDGFGRVSVLDTLTGVRFLSSYIDGLTVEVGSKVLGFTLDSGFQQSFIIGTLNGNDLPTDPEPVEYTVPRIASDLANNIGVWS